MSKLDYSNDDLSEITIEISYDYAKLKNAAEIGLDTTEIDATIGGFFDGFE